MSLLALAFALAIAGADSRLLSVDTRVRRGDPPLRAAPTAEPFDRMIAALSEPDRDAAWKELKQLAMDVPEQPWGELGMARIYRAWHMPDQARGALERALKVAPHEPAVLVERGFVSLDRADLAAARADARAVLALAPRDPLALQLLARVLDAEKSPAEQRRAAWQAALDAAPEQITAREALLELSDDKLKLATELAQMLPQEASAQRRLAELRRAAGDQAGAADALEAAARLGLSGADVWRQLADDYRAQGRTDDEERALRRLRRLEPKNRETLVRLFNLTHEGDAREELARALLQLDAKDAGAHLALALRKAEKGDSLGELDELELAEKGTPHPDAPDAPAAAARRRAAVRAELLVPDRPIRGNNPNVISANASRVLTSVYDRRRAEHPELAGRMALKLKLGAGGHVDLVELVEDTVGDKPLAACIVQALKEGQYGLESKTLTLRFELHPPKEASR